MNKEILKRYSFGLLCLMCSLVSCSEEQPIDRSAESFGKSVEVRLQVNAPQGSIVAANEDAIRRLRLVVFGSIGSPDAGKLILNKYYATVPAGNSLKEIITSGKRDIYIIVNEPLGEMVAELGSYKDIATVADVRRLSPVYQGTNSLGAYIPQDIPMFVQHINESILADDPNTVSGTVERIMAKVTLNLNIKNSNFLAGKQVVIDHITLKNLPRFSYLIPQNYTGDLVASEQQEVKAVAAANGYNFSSTNTFYVPEYLFNDPGKGAYIEIAGHINGEAHSATKWRVKLGDAMDDNQAYSDKYHITRNRHYTFTGDVKSYGQQDGVAVKVTVAPWNTVGMEETVGRYVSFTKVTDSNGSTIAEGTALSAQGATVRVVCNTNIGGWYTVTRNAKGAIVHQSSATSSVTSPTNQTVSITIPKVEDLSVQQSYTVGIYHRTIAPESVGPVREIHFTQGAGWN